MKKWTKITSVIIVMAMTVCMGAVQTSKADASKEGTNEKMNVSNIWGGGYNGYSSNGCYSGKYLYYNIYDDVYRMDVDTRKKTKLFGVDGFAITTMLLYNGYFYMVVERFDGTGGSNPYICKSKLDGTEFVTLDCGDNLSISNDKIFYVKRVAEKESEFYEAVGVYSMNLEGTEQQELLKDATISFSLCDGNVLYYANMKGTYQSTLTNTGITDKKKLASAMCVVIGVYKDRVYYTKHNYARDTTTLFSKNLSTGKKTKLQIGVVEYCSKIDQETGWIYYVLEAGANKKKPIYSFDIKTRKSKYITKERNIYNLLVFGKNIVYTYTDKKSMTVSKVIPAIGGDEKRLGRYYCS